MVVLVDSTGIKMTAEGRWKTRKHRASCRRQWRTVHLGIDAGTLVIRAIEVTANAIGDAPALPGLLAQIPQDEQIPSVGGDGAYDTRACRAAIATRDADADADAVIPVGRNGQLWIKEGPGVDARNKALCATKRLGRACGRSGAATIVAVWPRPKCTTSDSWANALWLVPSIARSPSSKSVLKSSIAFPKWERRSPSASHNIFKSRHHRHHATFCPSCHVVTPAGQ